MKNSKFLRSKNLLKSLEAEELKSLNDERQERKNNGNIDSVSERYRSHGMTDRTERCQTKTARNDRQKGFTLVELVITIAIVIILSVISVPIYRGYVDKAKYAEAYALFGTILSAQKSYYSEYGYFYNSPRNVNVDWTSVDPNLGIDVRGNKYFTVFYTFSPDNVKFTNFTIISWKPTDLYNGYSWLGFHYNITTGAVIRDHNAGE